MAFIKYVDKNIHSYIRMKAFIRTIKGIIIIPPSTYSQLKNIVEYSTSKMSLVFAQPGKAAAQGGGETTAVTQRCQSRQHLYSFDQRTLH